MKEVEIKRTDDAKDIVVSDEMYALVKTIGELAKAVESLAARIR